MKTSSRRCRPPRIDLEPADTSPPPPRRDGAGDPDQLPVHRASSPRSSGVDEEDLLQGQTVWSRVVSSATEPVNTTRPPVIITTWLQVCSTSPSRWLDTTTVRPAAA